MPRRKVVLTWSSLSLPKRGDTREPRCASVKFYEPATGHNWHVELEKCGNETAMRLCLVPSEQLNMYLLIKYVLHVKKRRRVLAEIPGSSNFSSSKLMSESYIIPVHFDTIDSEVKVCVEFGVPIYTPFQPVEVNHKGSSTLLPSVSYDVKLLAKDKQDFRFLTFLQSGNYSDVTISVEGREIKCHKSALSWRSPYFDAMFKSGLIESMENRIEITDFDYDTVSAMINFLYTFECPELSITSGMDLLKIADKYQVPDLRDTCGEFLVSEMNATNVMEILMHADVHSIEKVKKRAMEYIIQNSNDFKEKEQYEPLMSRPDLLRDLLLAKGAAGSSSGKGNSIPAIVWYNSNPLAEFNGGNEL